MPPEAGGIGLNNAGVCQGRGMRRKPVVPPVRGLEFSAQRAKHQILHNVQEYDSSNDG